MNETVVMIKEVFSEITAHILLFSGPVLVTAEGDAPTPHPETGAVLAHAPGKGGGGTAADPALAAEDTVTAMSEAPGTSKYSQSVHASPTQNVSSTFAAISKSSLSLQTCKQANPNILTKISLRLSSTSCFIVKQI